MGIGTIIIIGAVLGAAFGIYMEVDRYRDIRKQNPEASRKQIFGQYASETIEDGERRKRERRESAQRRNERYLDQVKMEMSMNGDWVYAEDEDKIYYIDGDGNTYSFDRQGHYIMEEY